ncbi:MAG: L-histidine N(alpha)-methyltransferase [Bacteroidota bacterium]
MTEQFAKDVLAGLSAVPKYLPSKYFYNEKGDKLFQEIMELEEYYLTRSEYDVLDRHKSTLLSHFKENSKPFHLIEFGAGDGLKTKLLLTHFVEQQVNFKYLPIDISANVLEELTESLKEEIPSLQTEGINDDYFHALGSISASDTTKKIVLFLGGNIGNFRIEGAEKFLCQLSDNLNQGDQLMIGFDLKKDPSVILNAYNDAKGTTAAFNMNLLDRINDELGADFQVDEFMHYPVYNPQNGETLSFIVSKKEQTVRIKALNTHYHFDAWEAIHTEISKKYDLGEIYDMAERCNFKVKENFFDSRKFFVDSLWERI